ncbi:unnamed protein product, partial [Meganyctiphanes norvegica]
SRCGVTMKNTTIFWEVTLVAAVVIGASATAVINGASLEQDLGTAGSQLTVAINEESEGQDLDTAGDQLIKENYLEDRHLSIQRGNRKCGKIGGRCVKNGKECPTDLPSEKPSGQPFCNKPTKRCCYNNNNGSSCPAGFESIGECCYYISSDHNLTNTWDGARTHCQELGIEHNVNMDLVEVGTEGQCCNDLKLMEVLSYIKKTFWFGATNFGTNGTWVWQHSGEVLSLRNNIWRKGSPEGIAYLNCLASQYGWWNDYHRRDVFPTRCSQSHISYVCQIFFLI